MRVFPSSNEKVITLVIFAFGLGSGLGAFTIANGVSGSLVFGAALTLISTFSGAWIAFSLESESRRKTTRKQQLEAANGLLFALHERMDLLSLFQRDFINPIRESDIKMVTMRPVANLQSPDSRLDITEIAFFFHPDKKSLLLTLKRTESQFQDAVNTIETRSNFHLDKVQPRLEAEGIVNFDEISARKYQEVLGFRNFQILCDYTDFIIKQVDSCLEKGEKLRKELDVEFTGNFSAQEVFRFDK